MAFSWNAWSRVLLVLDLCVVLTAFGLAGLFLRRSVGLPRDPTPAALRALRLAALLTVLLWAVAGKAVGGIVGFCLIARAAWTSATVSLPLLLALLARRWRMPWLWPLAGLLVAFKFYGEVWEPSRLEVERLSIPVAGLKAPVRIAHLSDLQTDGIRLVERRALEAAAAFEPDLTVFTGDVQNHPSLWPEVRDYLAAWRAKSGKLFVSGNVDGGLDLAAFERETGFQVLDRRSAVFDLPGGRVAVLGFGLEDFRDEALLDRLVRDTRGAVARVALSHLPDAHFMMAGRPIDLLFAGHTHGGQVCLPWFGPIVTLSGVSRRMAAGGLTRAGTLAVIVSRGLGWEGHVAPRVRAFSRPHLVLVELVPA